MSGSRCKRLPVAYGAVANAETAQAKTTLHTVVGVSHFADHYVFNTGNGVQQRG